MSNIRENINLKRLTTFGVDAACDFFVEINSIEEFIELTKNKVYQSNRKLILGGGSNILFTNNFKGIIVKNNIKGIELISETEDTAVIKASAGEIWHDFVMWCLGRNYPGLENLSLIPGCVGAAPMQNIGAYGIEIKEVFKSLEAYSLMNGDKRTFTNSECEFGYRESVFKNKCKDQYFIASVTFELNKHAPVNTSYGAINDELRTMNVFNPTSKDVSDAVIRIRQSKLPDPKEIGNAGSFFKNPEVPKEKYLGLKNNFPQLVAYPLANGSYKLAAGWLIEQCGLKGVEKNGAAVHHKQALVLTNKNNATGKDVYDLSTHVLKQVHDKFGVQLEREVNIV